jgi:threonyl-tRNA synthetase
VEFTFKATDIEKHSAAHVMAAAVKELFEDVKVGVGPVTKEGFYYDFEVSKPISQKDFEKIEEKINQIIKQDLKFERIMLPKDTAVNMLLHRGEIYKMEMAKALNDPEVSFYKLGEIFVDLCRGPHVKSSGELGIIKLDRVEETHWNNDGRRPKMYRIYGQIFKNSSELDEYTNLIEKAAERNFEEIAVKNNLLMIADKQLWLTNKGKKLKDNIWNLIDGYFDPDVFSEIKISLSNLERYFDLEFKNRNYSYKELPALFKNVYESQPETIDNDSLTYISFINPAETLSVIGEYFDKITDVLKFLGGENIEVEIMCEDLENRYVIAISNLLQKKIISHTKVLKERLEAEIMVSFKIVDSIKKRWSVCKFGLNSESDYRFVNIDNKFGKTSQIVWTFDTAEIFKYLIEELKLRLPYELSVYKVRCLPMNNKLHTYAEEIKEELNNIGIECETDLTSKSIKRKIYLAERDNVSFVLVVGSKEEATNSVSVRFQEEQVGLISLDNLKNFIEEHKKETWVN